MREMLIHHPDDQERHPLLDSLYEDARDTVYGTLYEGMFDPYILKCIFLAGGGGSGKGFISELMFGTTKDMATTSFGIKSLNSDNAITALTGNLDTQATRGVDAMLPTGEPMYGPRGINRYPVAKDPDAPWKGGIGPIAPRPHYKMTQDFFSSPAGIDVRKRAKDLNVARGKGFVRGRLGLIIDGTADDPAKIARLKRDYESLGYDCSMVFVNTSLEVALKRNAARARNVPDAVMREAHANVQKAIPKFRRMFGSHTLITRESYKSMKVPGMVEVDNSESVSPQEIKSKLSPLLWKVAKTILEAPLQNPIGYEWLEQEAAGLPPSMRSKVTWLGKKKGA